MKILFIAPLPPPLNGQSLTAKIFLKSLEHEHEVVVVDLIKTSHKDGLNSIWRVFEIIRVLFKVLLHNRKADLIYLHVSESLAGNLRDLLIYLMCFRKSPNFYIHLHGGSLKKWVFEKSRLLFQINKFFISKLAGAIILGKSHLEIYSNILEERKIHIVPNFTEDYLFIDEHLIREKYQHTTPLNILYLSNLIAGKGYEFLLKAFFQLDDSIKNQLSINFAGRFESDKEKAKFLAEIKDYDQVRFFDFVQGSEKKQLLHEAHVLCFPSYLYEGQGICILEAYSSGCAVITTGKSGIADIFSDQVNGFQIQERSALSIKLAIEQALDSPGILEEFALNNYEIAVRKYRSDSFTISLKNVMNITSA